MKACCNTVMQFAEFMHAGNNIVGGQAFLSEYWRGQVPPFRILGGSAPPPSPFLLHCWSVSSLYACNACLPPHPPSPPPFPHPSLFIPLSPTPPSPLPPSPLSPVSFFPPPYPSPIPHPGQAWLLHHHHHSHP